MGLRMLKKHKVFYYHIACRQAIATIPFPPLPAPDHSARVNSLSSPGGLGYNAPPMRPIFTLTIFLLAATAATAEPWQLEGAQRRPGAFLAGFFSGCAAHELGHIAVAGALGYDAEFDGVTLVYPEARMTDAEHLQVASGGFQAQWLVSEAALRYREKAGMSDFGDSYSAGLVFSHLAISVAYLTVLKDHEDGDIEGMSEATGLSNDQLAGLIAIPALLDCWRLFDRDVPDWVPAVSVGSKAVGLAAVWTW